MSKNRTAFLWALFLLQVVCTVFFVGDAVIDMGGTEPDATAPRHDIAEFVAAFALLAGTAFTGIELMRLMRRHRQMADQIDVASGAFANVLATHFETWGLTGAERDVALMAIKGFSVADVARIRNTAEGTVKAQNAAIYRKAGVTGRLQLLSLFVEELLDTNLLPEKDDAQTR